jgi:hypothetical protein
MSPLDQELAGPILIEPSWGDERDFFMEMSRGSKLWEFVIPRT